MRLMCDRPPYTRRTGTYKNSTCHWPARRAVRLAHVLVERLVGRGHEVVLRDHHRRRLAVHVQHAPAPLVPAERRRGGGGGGCERDENTVIHDSAGTEHGRRAAAAAVASCRVARGEVASNTSLAPPPASSRSTKQSARPPPTTAPPRAIDREWTVRPCAGRVAGSHAPIEAAAAEIDVARRVVTDLDDLTTM